MPRDQCKQPKRCRQWLRVELLPNRFGLLLSRAFWKFAVSRDMLQIHSNRHGNDSFLLVCPASNKSRGFQLSSPSIAKKCKFPRLSFRSSDKRMTSRKGQMDGGASRVNWPKKYIFPPINELSNLLHHTRKKVFVMSRHEIVSNFPDVRLLCDLTGPVKGLHQRWDDSRLRISFDSKPPPESRFFSTKKNPKTLIMWRDRKMRRNNKTDSDRKPLSL